MTGLRERKKQRTREALIRAAIELFIERGYEQTTVDEIAAAVDVSQRTFFRYFATKEDVAFALHDMIEQRFFAAVREQPPGVPPSQAMRIAIESTWNGIGASIEDTVPVRVYMRMWQTIEQTPALVAVLLRRSIDSSERLAAEIARREGVDLETDPRPRVVVAAYTGVMQAAARHWGTNAEVTVDAARERTMAYLDQLGPSLSEDWGTGRKD
ncbi:TetR family transcriptional regulator [Streptomyces coryli]|uniref:TetR family transcriptional regulator n=1 Tax=Streptomyces coryli TaxID=1128680 RepID=UPI0030B8EAFD